MVVTDNQQISTLRQQKQTKHKYKKPELNIQLGDLEHYFCIME